MWKQRIDIKSVITKHKMDDENLSDYDIVSEEFKHDLVQEVMKAVELKKFADDIEAAVNVEDMNQVLEDIYAEADVARIWTSGSNLS